jgi:hypothetical protein
MENRGKMTMHFHGECCNLIVEIPFAIWKATRIARNARASSRQALLAFH